jgi:hypothetical protein
VSPSGYLAGLVVVIGLGTLDSLVRSLQNIAHGRIDPGGGLPMRTRVVITLFAGTLDTVWVAAAGALQAPKG